MPIYFGDQGDERTINASETEITLIEIHAEFVEVMLNDSLTLFDILSIS
jgi:hypothetical protein